MKDDAAARILIKGRVQGVGYRFFAQASAERYGLKGWVRNLPQGHVECEVEGPRAVIEHFLNDLRKGPSLSQVEAVDAQWKPASGQFSEFTISG